MKIVMSSILALWLASCAAEPATDSAPADSSAVESTSDKIASIQERLQGPGTDHTPLEDIEYRIDQERFAPFRMSDGRLEFRGRTLAEVEQALGKPFDSKRSGAREVVLYRIHPDDSTTLYLYAADGRIERFLLDEFNGWEGSSALSWFHF